MENGLNPVEIANQFTERADAGSQAMEAERRMPQPLADDMARAGLFRMLVPEQYGGGQCHPWAFFQALQTLARADGAVGWCAMIGATTGLLSASLPEEWAREIYAADPDVITVGVTAPLGKALPSSSQPGLTVSGRWPFASGSQVSDWICGGCTHQKNGETVLDAHGRPESLLVFFPTSDVTIHDTWDTSGLRGTGSHDFEVTDVDVPDGRWVVLGGRPRIDAPLYRFPTLGLLALGVSAVAVGIAQRAIDEFVALAGGKTPTGATRSLANRPMAQRDLALALADLESARALTRGSIEEAYARADQGQRLTVTDKANLRLAATNNAWSAVRAVDTLYHAAGGTSIYTRNRLQQCFRDVHVTTQHIMVGQPTYEVVGRVHLGLDPKQPL